VLEARRKAVRRAVEGQFGEEIELRTTKRKLVGKVELVTDEGVDFTIRKKLLGAGTVQTRVQLKWADIAPEQEAEFARKGGWKAATPDGAVALAYLALARKDTAAAGRALGGAGKHPLAAHLRARVAALGGPAAGRRRPGPEPVVRKERKPDPGPTRGLVGWWKFDDGQGTVARDSTGRGNHGRISGARRVRGKVGGALDFDGTSSHVEIPSLGALMRATLAVWVNIDTVPQMDDALFDTDDWGRGSLHFAFTQSGAARLNVSGSEPSAANTAFTAADIGSWVHIAVTYDSVTGTTRWYRNGRPDGDRAVGAGAVIDLSGGGTGSNIGSFNMKRHFDGKLDDFRIYARALSGDEVRALAAGR
jgi:hypothetical protein